VHRSKLIQAIADYAARYPHEGAVVERFHGLLDAHANCFDRDCWAGHITGSAWLVDPEGTCLLLTHHKKLDMWLQLGGHSDGDPDTAEVAIREASEESGLTVALVSSRILDLDVHEIPARKADPAHFHFDVRFALRAASRDYVVSDESHDLAWVPIDDIESFTTETSILRMREKWNQLALEDRGS
jgi:8-oxo-dGTP pyrophosphatase MutT (NUDIX family)